jgi:hypothetical protein
VFIQTQQLVSHHITGELSNPDDYGYQVQLASKGIIMLIIQIHIKYNMGYTNHFSVTTLLLTSWEIHVHQTVYWCNIKQQDR